MDQAIAGYVDVSKDGQPDGSRKAGDTIYIETLAADSDKKR